VLVFNKIDAVPELAARGSAVERDEYGNISRVFLSARTGQGLDALRAAIAEIATAEYLSDEVRDVRGVHDVLDVRNEPQDGPQHEWPAAPHDSRKVPEHGH
jgi:GTP-binding protein HflX